MPPFRFLVDGRLGQGAQPLDGTAIGTGHSAGNFRSWRFVHERHELVRKSRHSAANADAADVGAPANAGHPAPLGHVAVNHRAPATQLDDAPGRTVSFGEVALLVVASAIAPLVDGLPEQPRGSQLVV